jgi:hypothetical protein
VRLAPNKLSRLYPTWLDSQPDLTHLAGEFFYFLNNPAMLFRVIIKLFNQKESPSPKRMKGVIYTENYYYQASAGVGVPLKAGEGHRPDRSD